MINTKDYTRGNLLWLAIATIMAIGVAIVAGLRDPTLWVYGVLSILALAFAVIVFLRPQFAAYALILAIYLNISRQFTDRGYPSVILPLVGITFFSIVAYYVVSKRFPAKRLRTSRIEVLLIVYAIVVGLSFFAADDKSRALIKIFDLVKDITIVYCIMFAIQKVEHWKRAIWVIIIVIAFLCAVGLFQVITKNYASDFFGLAYVQMQEVVGGNAAPSISNPLKPRLSGPINAPNLWAQVVVAVFPLVIYRMIYEKRKIVKLLSLLILGLLLFELLFTYSRGGYLTLGLTVIAILLERRVNLIYIIAGLILVPLIVSQVAPPVFVERATSLAELSPTQDYGIYQDSAFRGRASEILTGVSMFADHPIFGVGVGNYENNYQKYTRLIGIEARAEERQPHSLYVQLMAETGIFGTLTFIGMVFLLLIELNRARNELTSYAKNGDMSSWITSLLVSVVAYLTTSLFLHGAYIRYYWVLIALAIIGINLASEISKNHKLTTYPNG